MAKILAKMENGNGMRDFPFWKVFFITFFLSGASWFGWVRWAGPVLGRGDQTWGILTYLGTYLEIMDGWNWLDGLCVRDGRWVGALGGF